MLVARALPERKRQDAPASAEKAPKPKKKDKEKFVDTGLVRLKVQAFPIDTIEPSVQTRQGTIVAIGDRILLADRTGHFFAIEMKEATSRVEPLPLRIDLHEQSCLISPPVAARSARSCASAS